MSILLFILVLVVLILVHEFGHFIVAKTFGIRVDEFGIFFPPRIFAFKWGETEYSLNWLPFGGFVKIYGENYDAKPEPRSFTGKSRWVQAAVIVAGIVCNLIFAWFILSAGYVVGLPTPTEHEGFGTVTNAHPTVVTVLDNSPAQKVGIMAGDEVKKVETATVSLDARTLNTSDQSNVVTNFITTHSEQSIIVTVLRGGKEMVFITKAADGIVPDRKVVGLQLEDIGTLRLPLHLALAQGAMLGYDITISTAEGLAAFIHQIFSGTANFSSVAGPIGITVFGAAAIKQGFAATAM